MEIDLKRRMTMTIIKPLNLVDIFDALADYEIFQVSGKTMSAASNYGYTDFEINRIFVDADRGKDSRIRTLMHEIAHVRADQLNIDDSERRADRVMRLTYNAYRKIRHG